MKKFDVSFINRAITLITALLVVIACTKETIIQGQPGPQGIQGEKGDPGENGYNTVVTVVVIDPGQVCTNGGTEIFFGLDTNENGQLDENEIQGSTIVCNGEDGQDGTDGQNGQNGSDGQNGYNSVISIVIINPGATCLNGGIEIFYGLDTNENGQLDEVERQGSEIVCNGQDANGAGVYDWSGLWQEETEPWAMEISNIVYFPTQTDNSNGFQNNKYTADVSLFGEVINTTFSPNSQPLGTYASSAVFYFNVIDNDNREWVNGIKINNIGSSSEFISANHLREENGIVTLVRELTFLKQ
ncbi:DUF7151 family protein [Lentiprolixibacter aurantiacus]|uniref:DUF7151 domain-containing protein n=1 Tax=Lentiprolixibacter aurantiacus TaxID=2993939 RepID=A0AAE3SN23_9FLAO|nr:hypothetical protein [Lentiprolixibacter aurantiacus]MCX2718906.1 hypothetical protein [Lentiprolixibacter aurantiacus]